MEEMEIVKADARAVAVVAAADRKSPIIPQLDAESHQSVTSWLVYPTVLPKRSIRPQ